MITEDKITEIFCLADDFCKYFSSELKKHQLSDGKKHRNKPGRLSDAEVITILILFHSKGFRCLKHFYTQYSMSASTFSTCSLRLCHTTDLSNCKSPCYCHSRYS